jgi:hypothetical protein
MIKDKIFVGIGALSTYSGIDGIVHAIRHDLSFKEAKITVGTAFDAYLDVLHKASSNSGDVVKMLNEQVLSIPDLWHSFNYVFAVPNITMGVTCLALGGYLWYKKTAIETKQYLDDTFDVFD